MVLLFLHAARRVGAIFAGRRLHHRTSSLFACLCTFLQGRHRLQKTDDILASNFRLLPLSLYPYVLKPGHFLTTACDSIESPLEELESAGNWEKIIETADIFREWGVVVRVTYPKKLSDVQDLQSKLDIFSRLGVKSADLVKMIHCRPRLLNCRINVNLNERLGYLEDLFCAKEVLVKAIVRNPSLLTCMTSTTQ